MIGATEREIATVATGSDTDRISKAAVVYDARAILKQITCTKQRALDAAAGAAGGTRA